MKTKFEQVAAKVLYSGTGKIGTLLYVSNPEVCLHFQTHTDPTNVQQRESKWPKTEICNTMPHAVYIPRKLMYLNFSGIRLSLCRKPKYRSAYFL